MGRAADRKRGSTAGSLPAEATLPHPAAPLSTQQAASHEAQGASPRADGPPATGLWRIPRCRRCKAPPDGLQQQSSESDGPPHSAPTLTPRCWSGTGGCKRCAASGWLAHVRTVQSARMRAGSARLAAPGAAPAALGAAAAAAAERMQQGASPRGYAHARWLPAPVRRALPSHQLHGDPACLRDGRR